MNESFKNIPADDPYGHLIKPVDVPVWDHRPSTPEEEALYFGIHLHTESNPLGLHTHVSGGKLGGGHSHGPQNREGVHYHGSKKTYMVHGDGAHYHQGKNFPDGEHEHIPDNFG